MRLILRPLFEAELPADFDEVVRSKLIGREVETGQEIEIDLLGRPLSFRVILAEPSPLKVKKGTRIEFSTGSMEVIDFEFDEPVRDVVPFDRGFVIVLDRKVLILNRNGQKIYSDEFEDLNGVRVSKDAVVIIHGEGKIRIVKP